MPKHVQSFNPTSETPSEYCYRVVRELTALEDDAIEFGATPEDVERMTALEQALNEFDAVYPRVVP